jgi:hypothetical protein
MEYNSIKVDRIVVGCRAGSALHECARESVVMALTERNRVVFTHNGIEYIVDPWEIIRSIMHQYGDGPIVSNSQPTNQ